MSQSLFIHMEPIVPTALQIQILYKLLVARKHNISNSVTPSYSEHESFVLNHPYRAWYLLYSFGNCIGTVYLSDSNTIGLNVKYTNEKLITGIIDRIIEEHKPLPEIKSVRANYFSINIPDSNTDLLKIFTDNGFQRLQTTFKI